MVRKNQSGAASEPREAGSHRFLTLSAGALLLAVGIFVGRRQFRG
jgi:hypothetical protein